MYDEDYSTDSNKICTSCGAKMVAYRHKLNTGMVTSLQKLLNVGGSAHLNALQLDYNQRCNFQKLRYWGLAGRAEQESGVWIISQYGKAFLAGLSTAPSHAWSYRGVPIDKDDPEISHVHFSDLMAGGSAASYDKRDDYSGGSEPHS